MKSADEYDVHTKWRKVLCWTQRAGATSKTKKMTRRRERRTARQQAKKEQND